ncbi:MAG: protein kinase [Planctomycetes bacterium]|nr:protein kinase [Planctomycetota bacterium]
MSEPVLQTGSSVASPVLPGEGAKPRVKGQATVINPERRGSPALPAQPATPGETGQPAASGIPKSSIVRLLFPPDEEAATLAIDADSGIQLGHFAVIDRIRTGGMGAVFRALDTRLNRVVALKVLPPALSRDPLIVQRFKNEGQAAAQLDHENVARVYFIGEEHGLHYIAFEFISGTNVRELIAQQTQLGVEDAVNYVLQIASALVHTSAQGVIHRDIKPSNIIITPTGRAKLVDLGLARKETKDDPAIDLTMAGTTLGTFDYISPEQARNPRSADVRSDIYSLGCTLYHMLTGEPPYPEGTVLQKLLQHQGDEAPDPAVKNRDVPENLSVVVRKMMAKDPRRRYQTAELLVRDLMLVAGNLGLRSISPEGLVWLASQNDQTTFWDRHLAWIVAAGVLLLIAGYLEFGPAGNTPPGDKPGSQGAALSSPSTTESPTPTPRTTAPNPSVPRRTASGQPSEAQPHSSSEKTPAENSTEQAASTPTKKSGTGAAIDETPNNSGDTESPEPAMLLRPVPLVAEGTRGNTLDQRFPLAVSRPATLDEDDQLLNAESVAGVSRKTSPGKTNAIERPRTREGTNNAVSPGETSRNDSERTLPDRPGSDDPATAAAEEDEGIFVLGRDASSSRRFSSLELACASVRENGAIIELRFNGKRRESALRINRKLTIRAAKGYHPVIELRPDPASIEDYQARAVWMPSGALDLVGVDLVLTVDETAVAESWSVFSVERPDVIRLDRVSVSIANPLKKPVGVFEFRLAPGALMPDMPVAGAPPRPPLKIELIDSLVRGNADLFTVRHTEPVRLAIDKSVIALQGSLLVAEGHTDIHQSNSQLELRLDHVTSVLGKGLIRFESGAVPRKLLPLQVSASNCIFSSFGSAPFVEMTGRMSPQDFRELLSWIGQNNFYDRYSTLWLINSMNETGARSEPWDADAWRKWSEATDTNPHFSPVVWNKRVWTSKPFVDLLPADFALDHTGIPNPAVGVDASFKDAGAELETLRVPSAASD